VAPFPQIPSPPPEPSSNSGKIAAVVWAVGKIVLLSLGGLLVVGLLFPSMCNQKDRGGNLANCQSNLKWMGAAIQEYNTNIGYMPSAQNYAGGTIPDGTGAQVVPSVFWLLLPNIEMDTVYTSPQPYGTATTLPIKIFICPSDPSSPASSASAQATSSYVLSQPVFSRAKTPIAAAMPDGTSVTIMASERLQTCGTAKGATLTQWGSPTSSVFTVPGLTGPDFVNTSTASSPAMPIQAHTTQANCTPAPQAYFQSAHPAGVTVLMGDGSVRVLPPGYKAEEVGYFCTPSARAQYNNGPIKLDF